MSMLVAAVLSSRVALAADPAAVAYVRVQSADASAPLSIEVGGTRVRRSWTPLGVVGGWRELVLSPDDPADRARTAWFLPVAGARYEVYPNPCSGFAVTVVGGPAPTGRLRVEVAGDVEVDALYGGERYPLNAGENAWIEPVQSAMCVGAPQAVLVVHRGADRWAPGAVVCSASVILLGAEDATVTCDERTGESAVR